MIKNNNNVIFTSQQSFLTGRKPNTAVNKHQFSLGLCYQIRIIKDHRKTKSKSAHDFFKNIKVNDIIDVNLIFLDGFRLQNKVIRYILENLSTNDKYAVYDKITANRTKQINYLNFFDFEILNNSKILTESDVKDLMEKEKMQRELAWEVYLEKKLKNQSKKRTSKNQSINTNTLIQDSDLPF